MQHFSLEIANQRIHEMITATEQESIARRFQSSLRERIVAFIGGVREGAGINEMTQSTSPSC